MPRRVVRTEPDGRQAADDLDLSRVAVLVDEGDPRGNLIALLQRAQDEFGYLPEPVVDEIARRSGVPASRIYGIITFYAQFSTVPSGRHKVCVCHGTACHVAGATRITEAVEQELGVGRRRHHRRHGVQPRLGRLHGRLFAGAGHARRRGDLRQPERRPDAQGRQGPASRSSVSRPTYGAGA